MNNSVGQNIFTTPKNQQSVSGFPVNRFYTKAQSDAKYAPAEGGVTYTPGSAIFVAADGKFTQNNSNYYIQNSASTPTVLATNTNVALSVNVGGDFSGTDAINIYGQYDTYLPNSAITNSLTGINTDGAVPAYSTSSSRGTGSSPIQLQANDMIGGFFGFGAQGASSPSYQNLGGMGTFTTGASTNNLGGELRWYTKGDGGSLAQWMSLSNSGTLTNTGKYASFGNTVPPVRITNGIDVYGTDNTINGVQLGVGNASAGTSAYTFLYMNNNLAVSADSTHYAGLGYTSSAYSDTTFGTGANVANQLQVWNTDGPTTFINSKASAQYVNFLIGGAATTNEIARLNTTGLGINTSAPTNSLTLGSTSTGYAHYNTADQVTNYQKFTGTWVAGQYQLGTTLGGSATAASLLVGVAASAAGPIARYLLISPSLPFYTYATGTVTVNTNQGAVDIGGGSALVAASSTQISLSITPTINQTSTAGFTSLYISPQTSGTGAGLGSGTGYLIDAGTSSSGSGGGHSQKFIVDQNGGTGIASQLRIGVFANNSVFSVNRTGWSVAAWGTRGVATSVENNTYNDSSSTTGTVGTLTAFTSLGAPTITSTNANVIYTTAANLYISGAPIGSGNASITNSWAIYVNSGNSFFIGSVTSASRIQANSVSVGTGWIGTGQNITYSTSSPYGTAGFSLNMADNTYNTTAALSSPSVVGVNTFGIPTLQATNAQTITSASTVYISGVPVASTGVTIASPYALYIAAGNTFLGGLVTTYNNIATTGNGIPSIYGTGRTVGATAAVASVATYTVGAADASFWISANVLITTATTHAFTVTVAYTSEDNTSRVLTLQFSNLAGTFVTSIANAAGAVPYEGVPLHIRCKASTAITIASAAGGVYTSVVYNIEGNITKIA